MLAYSRPRHCEATGYTPPGKGSNMMLPVYAIPLLACLVAPVESPAAVPHIEIDRSQLTLERIFDSPEFQAKDVTARWVAPGATYEVWEASREGGTELVNTR